MTQGVGTACWLAPEVINYAHASKDSDVYAFGIVLWEVFTRYVMLCRDGCSQGYSALCRLFPHHISSFMQGPDHLLVTCLLFPLRPHLFSFSILFFFLIFLTFFFFFFSPPLCSHLQLQLRHEVYEGLSAAQIIAKVANEGLRPRVPRDCPWASIMTECWQQDASQR